MPKTPPTFRALDLGFVLTKFSKGEYLDDGSLEVGAFPSYAAYADDSAIGADVISDLSLVHVSVDDERFAVGEDVRWAADGVDRQMLELTFFTSRQYIALARGAMALSLKTLSGKPRTRESIKPWSGKFIKAMARALKMCSTCARPRFEIAECAKAQKQATQAGLVPIQYWVARAMFSHPLPAHQNRREAKQLSGLAGGQKYKKAAKGSLGGFHSQSIGQTPTGRGADTANPS